MANFFPDLEGGEVRQDASLFPETGTAFEVSRRQRPSRRRGFTLAELLLVTVILGVLATLVAPYLARAREMAMVATIRSDLRNMMTAVETYVTVEGTMPASVADLEVAGYTPSEDVEYCWFVSVPKTASYDAYVVAVAAHRGTPIWVWTLYPREGGRMWEFNSGMNGCP